MSKFLTIYSVDVGYTAVVKVLSPNEIQPILTPSSLIETPSITLHALQDDTAATISRKPCDKAVDYPHAIWCGRRCQSCSGTFSEKHGRGKSHLHPSKVNAKTLTGALTEGIE